MASARKTPKYGHEPLQMNMVAARGDFEQPGDFCFEIHRNGREVHFIVIAFPCSAGDKKAFHVAKFAIDHNDENNGNLRVVPPSAQDAPNLHPTLHVPGVWHGWVRAGQLVEA